MGLCRHRSFQLDGPMRSVLDVLAVSFSTTRENVVTRPFGPYSSFVSSRGSCRCGVDVIGGCREKWNTCNFSDLKSTG